MNECEAQGVGGPQIRTRGVCKGIWSRVSFAGKSWNRKGSLRDLRKRQPLPPITASTTPPLLQHETHDTYVSQPAAADTYFPGVPVPLRMPVSTLLTENVHSPVERFLCHPRLEVEWLVAMSDGGT